ncbi:MAG: gliding motility lipoprotein GldH [Salibacteraceae bacterium]
MKKFWGILIFASLILSACDPGLIYEENNAISNRTWNSNERIPFEFEIQDTINSYNIYLNIRNAKTYAYANLYVFYHTYLPDGTYDMDTLQFILAEPSGKWIGNSSGDLITNQVLFRRKIQFPQAGKYRFEVEQGMRDTDLEGISDIGLRVAKSE